VSEQDRRLMETASTPSITLIQTKIDLEDSMHRKVVSRLFSLLAATVFAGVLTLPAMAQESHVTVASQKSFDQTVGQLKSAVSQGGMMIMGEVNQGNKIARKVVATRKVVQRWNQFARCQVSGGAEYHHHAWSGLLDGFVRGLIEFPN
jgi:hypothetical protein